MENSHTGMIAVSIIIPVYNVDKYLPACLDSVLNQCLRDIEVIVIDDGSTDNTGLIADRYAEKDLRLRVIHCRNGNPGATRNVGLAVARGEYIGFIDGDDWIDPEMYQNLYQQAKIDNSDIVVTGVVVEFIRDNRKVYQQLNRIFTIGEQERMTGLFFRLKEASLFAYPVNKIYRRSLLQQYSVCFPELLPYEDLVFNLKVFKVAGPVSLLPGTPYHYIRRDELSAAGAYSPAHLKACKLAEDTFWSFFNHLGFPADKTEAFLRIRRITDYSIYAIGFYKKNCLLKRKERIARLKEDLFENDLLRRDIYLSSPNGFHERIFYYLLQHTTPQIMDYIYLFLFFFRRHCDPVYRQFRKVILK